MSSKREQANLLGNLNRVDTADPNLHNELDGFISNLERIAVLKSEPSLSDRS
jgi:hypothetical protein